MGTHSDVVGIGIVDSRIGHTRNRSMDSTVGQFIRLGALVAVLLVAIGNVLPDAGAGLQLLEELGQCGSRGRFGNVTPEIWLKPGLNHCDLVEYIINLGSAGMTNNILCKGARGPVIPNIVVSIRKGL